MTFELFPSPSVLLQVGPFALRWYALAYIAALVLGWRIMRRLVRLSPAVATEEQTDDFLTWATLGVVLGGRLGYVLFYQPAYYLSHPLQALAVWEGGMSFHGGALGVIVATAIYARLHRLNVLGFADRLVVALSQPFLVADRLVTLGGSVGVAHARDLGDEADAGDVLLRDADIAMYAAKAAGKGRVQVFEPTLRDAVVERSDLVADLRTALQRDELQLTELQLLADDPEAKATVLAELLDSELDGTSVMVGDSVVSFIPGGPQGRPQLHGELLT